MPVAPACSHVRTLGHPMNYSAVVVADTCYLCDEWGYRDVASDGSTPTSPGVTAMPARLTATSRRRPAPYENLRARPGRLAVGALVAAVALAGLIPVLGGGGDRPTADLTAASPNPPTPRDFTGFGFDQCLAPTQSAMDAWLQHSPFLSVGIYISGNSRACRNQPNLTSTWVRTQLARGWQLLPITLGPQASCSSRYPKYRDDPTINPDSTSNYAKARNQGKLEAERAVAAAGAIGIVPKSTLFYDLEAFDLGKTHCRESAIRFVHGWTKRLHELDYRSGFYSSAGSGIKMLDTVRARQRTTYRNYLVPDVLWIARWDGKANTSVSSSYLAPTAWTPGARVKQYQGGHNETWGGVTINIDRNYLDLGDSTPARVGHCGGIRLDLSQYLTIAPPTATIRPGTGQVRALKCLLTEEGYFGGNYTGTFGTGLRRSVQAWQRDHGFSPTTTWTTAHWMSLLADGDFPVLKTGSRGEEVRRAQRALRAAMPSLGIVTDGIFDGEMRGHVRAYRSSIGMTSAGIVNSTTWRKLRTGVR